MLENYYFVAGIVVAAVAVIGLFLKNSSGKRINKQNARISGSNNTVNQNAGAKREDKK